MNKYSAWTVSIIILGLVSLGYMALVGFLIWYSGILWLTVILIFTPIFWIRIKVDGKPDANNTDKS